MKYNFAATKHTTSAMTQHHIVNIIDGADGCCIMLYGDIGDWGSVKPEDIVRELMSAEREGRPIDVHINSVGGEVYAALAIFNALRASRAEVTIYIDCLAASAASVIAGCGRPVQIADNGRLMIHKVRGGAYGTIEEIRTSVAEMESLESVLIDIYARRTGLTPEAIRTAYFDGQDHWLTAEEALRLGFVDGIFTGEGIEPATATATPQQICDAYTQRYLNSLDTHSSKSDTNMLNQLRSRPRFTDCADETAALARVAELEQQASAADALRSEREALQAERDRLQAENEELRRQQQQAEEAETERALAELENRGLIPAGQKDNARAMLRADKTAAMAYFGALKPGRRIVNELEVPASDREDALEKRKDEVRKKLGR